MKPTLTIWEITNPNIDWEDLSGNDIFFRWVFRAYGIFVTSNIEYAHQGHCRRRGLEWILKHGYSVPGIKYNERTNAEFLA